MNAKPWKYGPLRPADFINDTTARRDRRASTWAAAVTITAAMLVLAWAAKAGSADTTSPRLASSWSLPTKLVEFGHGAARTAVYRVSDGDVACFVIPNQYCSGDCSYTPAISCLRVRP